MARDGYQTLTIPDWHYAKLTRLAKKQRRSRAKIVQILVEDAD